MRPATSLLNTASAKKNKIAKILCAAKRLFESSVAESNCDFEIDIVLPKKNRSSFEIATAPVIVTILSRPTAWERSGSFRRIMAIAVAFHPLIVSMQFSQKSFSPPLPPLLPFLSMSPGSLRRRVPSLLPLLLVLPHSDLGTEMVASEQQPSSPPLSRLYCCRHRKTHSLQHVQLSYSRMKRL